MVTVNAALLREESGWVAFVTQPHGARKTGVWTVETIDGGECLGVVKFYPQWRRYAFFPALQTVYESDCLRNIADFCETQTRKWGQSLLAKREMVKERNAV
jgi:hypothetical protein